MTHAPVSYSASDFSKVTNRYKVALQSLAMTDYTGLVLCTATTKEKIMDFEFMQIYTDLRCGKMSFHQFMDFVSSAYAQGHRNGLVQSSPVPRASLAPSGNATCARLDYEAVF